MQTFNTSGVAGQPVERASSIAGVKGLGFPRNATTPSNVRLACDIKTSEQTSSSPKLCKGGCRCIARPRNACRMAMARVQKCASMGLHSSPQSLIIPTPETQTTSTRTLNLCSNSKRRSSGTASDVSGALRQSKPRRDASRPPSCSSPKRTSANSSCTESSTRLQATILNEELAPLHPWVQLQHAMPATCFVIQLQYNWYNWRTLRTCGPSEYPKLVILTAATAHAQDLH